MPRPATPLTADKPHYVKLAMQDRPPSFPAMARVHRLSVMKTLTDLFRLLRQSASYVSRFCEAGFVVHM